MSSPPFGPFNFIISEMDGEPFLTANLTALPTIDSNKPRIKADNKAAL
jgi:hypothetical protein